MTFLWQVALWARAPFRRQYWACCYFSWHHLTWDDVVSLLLWLDERQEQYPFKGLQRWVWTEYYTIADIQTIFFFDDYEREVRRQQMGALHSSSQTETAEE